MAVNLSFIGGAGWQFFDNNGVPLAGGKIYTYYAGTTTPQATYTSRSGTTANSNPIILDAAGRTPQQIWSTEGTLYKYVVADANDVVIRTWDNIGGSVVASDLAQDLANTATNAKGDALIGFKQSNAAGFLAGAVGKTVNDKLQEVYSVKDFGAAGDGVNDDSAAFAAAVAALPEQGGAIYVPPGTYLLESSLTINEKTVHLYGAGQKSTELQFGSTVVDGIVFDGGPQSNLIYNIFTLKSLRITTNNKTGGGVAVTVRNDGASGSCFTSAIISEIDIKFENTGQTSYGFYDVVGYWTTGILLDNAGGTVIEKCFIQGQNAPGNPSNFKLRHGIKVTGLGDPTVYSINDTQVYYSDVGLTVTDTNAEGFYVRGCTFVNVNIGVDWDTADAQIQFEWAQGHISSRKRGFRLRELSQFAITDSMFQMQNSPGGNYFDWDCIEAANYTGAILFGFVSNCVIIAADQINPTTGLPIIKRGVVVANGGGLKIHNNWFYNMDSAIVYGATVTGCWALGNQFVICTTNVSDANGGNFGQHLITGTFSVGTAKTNNTVEIKGSFSRGAPVTKTGNFTLAATENWVIVNASGTVTVSLPTPSQFPGRELTVVTRNAQQVVSSLSNIGQLAGSVVNNEIVPATAGAWATLVSDGVNWIKVAAGAP